MAESAARITKHMNACADAVTEIDSIKDGSHYFFGKKDGQGNAYYDQKHYNMHVWDNLNHLKLQTFKIVNYINHIHTSSKLVRVLTTIVQ